MNDATKVSIKNETNNIMNLCNLLSWNALLQNNKINAETIAKSRYFIIILSPIDFLQIVSSILLHKHLLYYNIFFKFKDFSRCYI